jgi:geranylgeranyl reductase family protein
MIVGAGITGCYLGSLIGEQQIWEKADSQREKPCGGLVSKKGFDSLKADRKCILNEVRGARLFAGERQITIEKKETQAYVIDRFALQKSLARAAENAGCDILYGKTWAGEPDDFIIGADGAVSAVGRFCGINDRKYIRTCQIETDMLTKVDPDFVEMHFGPFAPGFFGWLIPLDEKRVRIGVGCNDGNPKDFLKQFLSNFHAGRMEKEQSALIPVFDPSKKTVFDNKALVGDAAAQVKASTGGGIIFGLRCAQALADAIKKDDLGNYERNWRRLYEKDLRNHLRVRRFLDKSDIPELFGFVKEKGLDKIIEQHGEMEGTGALFSAILRRPSLWPAALRLYLSF